MPRLSLEQKKRYQHSYFWVFGKFKEFAKSSGLQLLDDDLYFLADILEKIPLKLHKSMLKDYVSKWVMMLGECDNAVQAQNFGRKVANLWIAQKADEEFRQTKSPSHQI